MTILIFGGTGVVGSEITKFFVSETQYDIHSTWRDEGGLNSLLLDKLLGKINFQHFENDNFQSFEVEKIIENSNPNYIINCFGNNYSLSTILDILCFQKNIKLINILENQSYFIQTEEDEEYSPISAMSLKVSRFILNHKDINLLEGSFGMTAREFASCCKQIIEQNLWSVGLFHLLSRRSDGTPDPLFWSKKTLTFDLKINSIEKQIEELKKDNI